MLFTFVDFCTFELTAIMKKILQAFFANRDTIYKVSLTLLVAVLAVYFLPKEEKFGFTFKIDTPWAYEDYYAPFSFSVPRNPNDIIGDRQVVENKYDAYFSFKPRIKDSLNLLMESKIEQIGGFLIKRHLKQSASVIQNIYDKGVFPDAVNASSDQTWYLEKNSQVAEVDKKSMVQLSKLIAWADSLDLDTLKIDWLPNVVYNQELTGIMKQKRLNEIPLWEGAVEKGTLLVSKGETVNEEIYKRLKAIEAGLNLSENSQRLLSLRGGYFILTLTVLTLLMLFIRRYRTAIYQSNRKVVFIFFNVLLTIALVSAIYSWQPNFVYMVPVCLFPILIKAFFDARTGLFAYVITLLICSLLVADGLMFLVVQMVAGIVTILTISESFKRAHLFISVGKIVLVYLVSYIALQLVYNGGLDFSFWQTAGMFCINGMLILAFSVPLFYTYEKLFGLISDYSLLELSDTNSPLLKELADKAPGTFHHSLQVANLSEAAAQEIGANAMLVRVGALYHDIGKMLNPVYFTENQVSGSNLHDELSNTESAEIIIKHVTEGIELAKKNKLPDRIIDFIRTHHGTSTVYYFYQKEKEQAEEVDKASFQYPGPIPFSKETAILMMADGVEAASKSLKNPTASTIFDFVERIIERQIEEKQLVNADISLKEIEKIKKILKRKLINIYHLRIEYPE